ncbi:PfkB family carbohydrate kinase [uncultured Modestobacter sp.]|uniref:PfkB family carbohydrate kinase n=1 Tax=uncultured Modestobacter sp. TaxID=380048 RepID=UPI002612B569|nr:PfkB family carbohydrate kinase [uncultured Modestobacter sp.]
MSSDSSTPHAPPAVLTVLGELVVDLLPDRDADAGPAGTTPHFIARPGGNALNVAVAAARLGQPVRLMARFGRGPLAGNLRRHAELAGVDLGGAVNSSDPVSLAVVGLAPDGSADYGFHVLGAADWQWTEDELAAGWSPDSRAVHIGSISSWTAPGCEPIAALAERLRACGAALVSVDPNIRPMLTDSFGNTPADVRRRLDRLVAASDVVKISAEDLAWLEPDTTDLDEAACRWAGRGPAVVLLTDGGAPLRVARPGGRLQRVTPPAVKVQDTVGAGDSLAAGFLSGLLRAGVTSRTALEELPDDALASIADEGALVAALACTRVGADPPTRAELEAAQS